MAGRKRPPRAPKDVFLVQRGKVTEIASLQDAPAGRPGLRATLDARQRRHPGLWLHFRLDDDGDRPKR